jgi:hypothetical protein
MPRDDIFGLVTVAALRIIRRVMTSNGCLAAGPKPGDQSRARNPNLVTMPGERASAKRSGIEGPNDADQPEIIKIIVNLLTEPQRNWHRKTLESEPSRNNGHFSLPAGAGKRDACTKRCNIAHARVCLGIRRELDE